MASLVLWMLHQARLETSQGFSFETGLLAHQSGSCSLSL